MDQPLEELLGLAQLALLVPAQLQDFTFRRDALSLFALQLAAIARRPDQCSQQRGKIRAGVGQPHQPVERVRTRSQRGPVGKDADDRRISAAHLAELAGGRGQVDHGRPALAQIESGRSQMGCKCQRRRSH